MIKAILIAVGLCVILGTGKAHMKTPEIIEVPPTETHEVVLETEEEVAETFEVIEEEIICDVAEPVKYFDVPLSTELQDHIFALCEEHNIAPGIIIAMIERESTFDSQAIGDKGDSFGLMQIQPKWKENQERMDRLGCHDLLNPFQNVTVAIDLVAELKGKNADLYWVLMSYNGGEAYGTRMLNAGQFSDYAVGVVARASELNERREETE